MSINFVLNAFGLPSLIFKTVVFNLRCAKANPEMRQFSRLLGVILISVLIINKD